MNAQSASRAWLILACGIAAALILVFGHFTQSVKAENNAAIYAAAEQRLTREVTALYNERFVALATVIGQEQLPLVMRYGQQKQAGSTALAVGTYVLTHKLNFPRRPLPEARPDLPPAVWVGMNLNRLSAVYNIKFPGALPPAEIERLALSQQRIPLRL